MPVESLKPVLLGVEHPLPRDAVSKVRLRVLVVLRRHLAPSDEVLQLSQGILGMMDGHGRRTPFDAGRGMLEVLERSHVGGDHGENREYTARRDQLRL